MLPEVLADLAVHFGQDLKELEHQWEACEVLAGCIARSQHVNPWVDTIAPISTLLGTDAEEEMRLASIRAGIDAGVIESSGAVPSGQCSAFLGSGLAISDDTYWFGASSGACYEVCAQGSTLGSVDASDLPPMPLHSVDACSDSDLLSTPPLDSDPKSSECECDQASTAQSEKTLAKTEAASGSFTGCEPNMIRSADDMYTPRWIRGIGRSKEGLCPVCYDNGT
ncbi:hypothetical protein H4R26_005500, partial [Coemansia thaxteri]